ncbi:hypothetical protein HY450_02190 [Candidatus Pacearchaeota archaeon]|nr:hypothetical protein [Candidatus Pacearchaeota archaeon]
MTLGQLGKGEQSIGLVVGRLKRMQKIRDEYYNKTTEELREIVLSYERKNIFSRFLCILDFDDSRRISYNAAKTIIRERNYK